MKNTPPSAQTEWEKITKELDVYLWGRKVTADAMENARQILPFIKDLILKERTRLLSVESMKMEEETELNLYSSDIEVSTNERIIEARNELRQSILSEMEKGRV